MKPDFLSTFVFLILLPSSCYGHGNIENTVCRRVDELYGICNSPQETTKRVAQGPPGKTGPKGAKGQIGPRGAVGPMGKNATVDYEKIESVIEEKVQTVRNNISHDIQGEVEITEDCESAGCHSVIPQYSLIQSEIIRIINGSSHCRQYIKLRCKGSVLYRNDMNSGLTSWWVSRDGEKMKYWGGATSRRDGYCACGETGSCMDNSYKCNCDQNSVGVIAQDEGYIIDKSKLPVRELRFGDMGDTGETGWYTLGRLECRG